MNHQPNIVLVMTDQQRADFFKSEGFPLDTMPFTEALGAGGVRFQNAYTPMPVCVPARTSTLTGRFPKATRVRENSAAEHVYAPQDLVATLRAQGYSINMAGKNHSYLQAGDFDYHSFYFHLGKIDEPELPEERAFDAWLKAGGHKVYPEPAPFPLECQLPYRVVSDAIAGLNRRDPQKPFFLWLSFPEPHNPYQVPEPYFSLFPEAEIPDRIAGPEAAEAKGGKWAWLRRLIEEKRPGYDAHWRRYRANYCGMIRLIDDQIQRFVDYLDTHGLADDTIFIFTSDHGDYAADYGLQRKGVGLPESLVRVPLFFRGPGIMPSPGPRGEFVSLVDIMPTLCAAIGAESPYGVQGRSLWPLLTGQADGGDEFRSMYAELGFGSLHYGEHERPPLHFPYDDVEFDELNSVTQSGNLKMVRMGRWKLLFDMQGRGEMYDLEHDPGELRDLFDDPAHRAVRAELVEELLRWTIRTEDPLPSAAYLPKRPPHNWYTLGREREPPV